MFRKLLLIVAILTVVYACGSDKGKDETVTPPQKVKVKTYLVKPVDTDSVRVFTASVSGDKTAVITPRIQGYIEKINVVPGQHVRAGQVLAIIRSDELMQKAAQAASGAMQAGNGIQQAQTGYSMAVAQQGQAQAQYDLAEKTYNRYVSLMKSDSVSKQEFDQVQSQYLAAKQGLSAARENVTLASQKIDQSKMAAGQAKAMQGEAGAYLSYTQLTAPFDGIILEKNADTGSFAAPGTPVLKISSDSPVVYTYVSQDMLTSIEKGTNAVISVDSLNKYFESRVLEISPDVDSSTGNFKVKLSASNGLVNGMFAKVRFVTGKEKVIAVPSSAVIMRGQLSIVFTDENGHANMRVVKTGRDFNGATEIISGLSDGDRVVTTNAVILRSGDILEAE